MSTVQVSGIQMRFLTVSNRPTGIGLSCFSAVLATIYQFKPQGITLSATFLCVISYVIALALEYIPKSGFIGRWFNPHSFNHKEHAAILISKLALALICLFSAPRTRELSRELSQLFVLVSRLPRQLLVLELCQQMTFYYINTMIVSSTAARSAMAAEVIAVQRLWYTKTPNAAVCIFLIFSSQILGYGIAGLLRKILVYPTKVVNPALLAPTIMN